MDVFSKCLWAKPLKSKSGKKVAKKLKKYLLHVNVDALQIDKGKSFYDTQVKTSLTKVDKLHFSLKNDGINYIMCMLMLYKTKFLGIQWCLF